MDFLKCFTMRLNVENQRSVQHYPICKTQKDIKEARIEILERKRVRIPNPVKEFLKSDKILEIVSLGTRNLGAF